MLWELMGQQQQHFDGSVGKQEARMQCHNSQRASSHVTDSSKSCEQVLSALEELLGGSRRGLGSCVLSRVQPF